MLFLKCDVCPAMLPCPLQCISIQVSTSVSFVYRHLLLSVHAYLCVCVGVSVCVCPCVRVCGCVCVCMCMTMCVYVHVCMRACACVIYTLLCVCHHYPFYAHGIFPIVCHCYLMCVILYCSANYPCDMITILHVVLYKTADPEHHVRERAAQLLHILDKSVVM